MTWGGAGEKGLKEACKRRKQQGVNKENGGSLHSRMEEAEREGPKHSVYIIYSAPSS